MPGALDYMLPGGVPASSRLNEIRQSQARRKQIAAEGNAFLAPGQVPYSGYMNQERDYREGLKQDAEAADIESRLTTGKGARTVASYPAASRPSMAALRGVGYGEDASGFYASPADRALRGVALDDAVEASRQSGGEYQRQRDTLRAADARTQAGINADTAGNRVLFDLHGPYGARTRMAGDVNREEALRQGRGASDVYFDPKVKAMREAEFYDRMEELRRRYSDPAIIKGQAALDEARMRGIYGVNRETTRGEYGLKEQGLRNEGAAANTATRAEAQIGAAVAGAGGNPQPYRPGVQPDPGKTMTQQEFDAFAREQNMTPQEAMAVARFYGYTIR